MGIFICLIDKFTGSAPCTPVIMLQGLNSGQGSWFSDIWHYYSEQNFETMKTLKLCCLLPQRNWLLLIVSYSRLGLCFINISYCFFAKIVLHDSHKTFSQRSRSLIYDCLSYSTVICLSFIITFLGSMLLCCLWTRTFS